MPQIPAETPVMAAQSVSACDDTKATLGYSYLQALALRAAFSCALVGRHADGTGVDVRFDIREKLDPQARAFDFSLDFQLRVTSRGLPVVHSKLLFSLETDRYDRLRSAGIERPQFIVLLNLPPSETDGADTWSAEDLIAQHRGRWLCLCGAPQASNAATTLVRFPTWNVFTPATLREIARRVSLGTRFFHEQ
jgi:hypothetical protein